MEPQDNKQLGLQKAVSAHEQAAASLADLRTTGDAATVAMMARIQQNLDELAALAASTEPGEEVHG
jgi:hypothetical protein